MSPEIERSFWFEAAHRLPHVPEEHKCHRLHGHSYRVDVAVRGGLDAARGWVLDFADLDRLFAPIREQLDHRYLNEIAGLGNPTSEVIAAWIWERLAPVLPGLHRIVVHETPRSRCRYHGPGEGPEGESA